MKKVFSLSAQKNRKTTPPLLKIASGIFFFSAFFSPVFAAKVPPEALQKNLVFKHELQSFSLPLGKFPDFLTQRDGEVLKKDFCDWPPKTAKTTENSAPDTDIETANDWKIDREKFRAFVMESVAPKIERETEKVRIFRGEKGEILFDGAGLDGKKIDFEKLYAATNFALKNDFPDIEIPIIETNPEMVVEDSELEKMGISELLAVGESDFSGSSVARMHNIEAGENRFDGVLIPKDATFSFNENLGAVDAAHGYLPELVIVGPKLSKEYGGGLCQVSSTTFRAALLAGLPIVERYNHSFAVHYYEPWGTDATIYLGGKNLRFQNDTPGAILIQTTMNRETKKLRFHLYGTKDGRVARFFGPFISNRVGALPSKVEASEKLAPGEKLSLSHAVAGFDARWMRFVIPPVEKTSAEAVYSFFSRYEPRAEWTLVGGANSTPENPNG